MQNLPFKDDTFDFVISDQVIEHIHDPKKAICESHRVLRKGGAAIHTTCFMNYFHPSPIDFWRFSPDALRYICKACGFSKIIQCEGWGSRIVNLLCFISDIFRSMKIPETRWSVRHLIATLNEERYPIVTWVVARK
jgi:ubiquinone/menaquinone biosynthesis C-methylase UbiE